MWGIESVKLVHQNLNSENLTASRNCPLIFHHFPPFNKKCQKCKVLMKSCDFSWGVCYVAGQPSLFGTGRMVREVTPIQSVQDCPLFSVEKDAEATSHCLQPIFTMNFVLSTLTYPLQKQWSRKHKIAPLPYKIYKFLWRNRLSAVSTLYFSFSTLSFAVIAENNGA